MAPEVYRLAYLHQWSPPDAWSFRVERDGVGLGFRRHGRFPDGPELILLCHYRLPGELLLDVRQLAPSPIPVPQMVRVQVGGYVTSLPVQVNRRERATVISTVRLTPEIRQVLNDDALTTLRVTLFDQAGQVSADVLSPWQTGFIRQDIAWSQCAGRYPGEP